MSLDIEAAIAAAVTRACAPLVEEVRQLRAAVEGKARYVSVADAAEHCGVSTRTMKRWIAGTEKSAPRVKIIRAGRAVRVDLASLPTVEVHELAAEARAGRKLRAVGGE